MKKAFLVSKQRKRHVNVMEFLVAHEFKVQSERLSEENKAQIDRVDVEAWALSRLPAHYATTKRGIQFVTAELLEKYYQRITSTVQQGIVVVLANQQPPDSSQESDEDKVWRMVELMKETWTADASVER